MSSNELTPMELAILRLMRDSPLGTDAHGKYAGDAIFRHNFGEKLMTEVQKALQSLQIINFIDLIDSSNDNNTYRLTPLGKSGLESQKNIEISSYSNISNSNIAHNSSNITQSIKLGELPADIQEKVKEFDAAVDRKDSSTMKQAFGYIADKAVDVAIALGTGALLR